MSKRHTLWLAGGIVSYIIIELIYQAIFRPIMDRHDFGNHYDC